MFDEIIQQIIDKATLELKQQLIVLQQENQQLAFKLSHCQEAYTQFLEMQQLNVNFIKDLQMLMEQQTFNSTFCLQVLCSQDEQTAKLYQDTIKEQGFMNVSSNIINREKKEKDETNYGMENGNIESN